MGGKGGLIEIVLVFAAVLAWGVIELRATRLDGKKVDKDKIEK